MLKKLGVIALAFLGGLIISLGLIKSVVETENDTVLYSHVIIGSIIMITAFILHKKYLNS